VSPEAEALPRTDLCSTENRIMVRILEGELFSQDSAFT